MVAFSWRSHLTVNGRLRECCKAQQKCSLKALKILNYILIKSKLSFNLNMWDILWLSSGNQLISSNHASFNLKQAKVAFLSEFFAEFCRGLGCLETQARTWGFWERKENQRMSLAQEVCLKSPTSRALLYFIGPVSRQQHAASAKPETHHIKTVAFRSILVQVFVKHLDILVRGTSTERINN